MPLPLRKSKVQPPPEKCPLSTCMEVLGGAWTPNVLWYLSAGPRRFSELRLDIPKVSAKVLTARLRQLEAQGVVIRRVIPSSPPSVEYSLSELGRELIPAIDAIVSVGHKLKQHDAGLCPGRDGAAGRAQAADGAAPPSQDPAGTG